jgi:hypothetical protein
MQVLLKLLLIMEDSLISQNYRKDYFKQLGVIMNNNEYLFKNSL